MADYDVPQSNTSATAPVERLVPEDGDARQANGMSARMTGGPTNTVTTPLDLLRAQYEKEIEREPVEFPIPLREGVSVEYDTNISSDDIEFWRKAATTSNRRGRRSGEAEADSFKMAALVIFHKAKIFRVDGKDVYIDREETKPLNFYEGDALRGVIQSHAISNVELVRAAFGNDAHVMSVGGQIIEAAGYGEEVPELVESNPTQD